MTDLPPEFAAQMADLTSHHIEGIAVMGDVPFDCPVVTQVEGNLWQGGSPASAGGKLPAFFSYVLNLYPWESYEVSIRTTVRAVKLFDRGEIPDLPLLEDLATWVNRSRKLGPTLVHLPSRTQPLGASYRARADPVRHDRRCRDHAAAREAIACRSVQLRLRGVAEDSGMMNDGQIRRIVQVCLAEMRDDLVRGDSGGQNDHNGLRAADALINALERQDLVIIEKGVRHEDLWDYLAPPGDHYGPDDL